MQRWEYLEITYELKGKSWVWSDTGTSEAVGVHLNRLGSQGWELVSVYGQVTTEFGSTFSKYFYYVLKRPVN